MSPKALKRYCLCRQGFVSWKDWCCHFFDFNLCSRVCSKTAGEGGTSIKSRQEGETVSHKSWQSKHINIKKVVAVLKSANLMRVLIGFWHAFCKQQQAAWDKHNLWHLDQQNCCTERLQSFICNQKLDLLTLHFGDVARFHLNCAILAGANLIEPC